MTTSPGPPAERLELPIGGMTCASCASRVERRLNGIEGVEASVNYATERATVSYDPGRVAPKRLVAAAEEAGYTARLPGPPGSPALAAEPAPADDPARAARRRLVVSAVLSAPVLLVSMIPALQFDGWQWLALQLATPVVLWGAWPFHRAAWASLRHASATMDTLISLGTLAAWGWSVVALLALGAGEPGMRMGFEPSLDAGAGAGDIYLEVAAAVTVFILAGRYLEARAKRRAGAAVAALMELGAKDVAVLDEAGAERRIPVEDLRGRPLRGAPRREGRDGRGRGDGRLGARPVAAHRRAGAGGGPPGRRGGRGHGQRRRAPGGARDAGGLGHRPGPDRADGHRCPVRQGSGAAAGRPGGRRLRAGGDRARGGDPRLLAGQRGRGGLRVHRRRGGPDHRLPVRPRARHAHRAPRGHGSRRPARHPEGHAVVAGRPALLAEWGLALPPALEAARARAEAAGRTVVAAAWDGRARALLAVADTPRPTSAEAIRRLRGLGLRPVLLTGDNARAARAVAEAVGVEEVVAEVLPAQKADAVRRLQDEGRVVAVVGDGVNDAPALAQADLGLAIGTGPTWPSRRRT